MKEAYHDIHQLEVERIELLHWGNFCLVLFSIVLELCSGFIGFFFIPKIAAALIFYRFFFKVKRNLQYSYWTLSNLLLAYLVYSLASSPSFLLAICYLLATVFLCGEMYLFFSPLYYPLIRWWEYDFRYRDDLKISVTIEGKKIPGRLTDLRRGAGCVALFAKHRHGTALTIKMERFENITPFKAEIVSRRCYSLGRPYTYGVRLNIASEKDEKNYDTLVGHWKNRRHSIKTLKRWTSTIANT